MLPLLILREGSDIGIRKQQHRTTTTYNKSCEKNHVKHKNNIQEKERTKKKKKKTFMYEATANDEEEAGKCVFGFCCDRYGDTVKKEELIRLYYIWVNNFTTVL